MPFRLCHACPPNVAEGVLYRLSRSPRRGSLATEEAIQKGTVPFSSNENWDSPHLSRRRSLSPCAAALPRRIDHGEDRGTDRLRKRGPGIDHPRQPGVDLPAPRRIGSRPTGFGRLAVRQRGQRVRRGRRGRPGVGRGRRRAWASAVWSLSAAARLGVPRLTQSVPSAASISDNSVRAAGMAMLRGVSGKTLADSRLRPAIAVASRSRVEPLASSIFHNCCGGSAWARTVSRPRVQAARC